MKLKPALLCFFIILLFLSCNRDNASKTGASLTDSFKFEKNDITIGTFNLEWFGDGNNDRIERFNNDYKNYAKIIKELDIDILGVQEVENDVALNKFVNKYLPDYTYYLGNYGGAQKIGLIFKKGLKIKYLGEYYPLMIQEGRTKPGLMVSCTVKNFDFQLMVVHLKSSSHYDNTPEKIQNSFGTRRQQAEALAYWGDSVLAEKSEEDLIVIGDFNDTPKRKKENTLFSLDNFIFITGDEKSCKFKNAYTIDHIITSREASERFIPNSVFMYNIRSSFTKEEAMNLSDHCPIIAKFDIKKADNDPPKRIAKK